MREVVDLSALSEIERDIYLNESWCINCYEADLGIVNPELYVENGRKYISGSCKVCGTECISEIIEKQMK